MKFIENIDKDESTRDVPWNGREIRNGMSPAIQYIHSAPAPVHGSIMARGPRS